MTTKPELPPFTKVLHSEIVDSKEYITKKREYVQLLQHPHMRQIVARLNALPSIGEAEHIMISQGYNFTDERPRVEFTISLRQDVKNPQLIRDLIRHGIAHKLTKKVSYQGGSLRVYGDIFTDLALAFRATIDVTGYVPSTCKVIYEDVVIPEHTEKKAKVICGPDEIDASVAGEDIEEVITS